MEQHSNDEGTVFDLENEPLGYAIEIGSTPEIVNCLRERSTPLPLEFVHKLANYLDPDRPSLPSGPKPRLRLAHDAAIESLKQLYVSVYLNLCEDSELAAHFLGVESFQLAEPPESILDEWPRPPYAWKFPHRVRERAIARPPSRGDVKDFVCKTFCIRERSFDDALAGVRRRIIASCGSDGLLSDKTRRYFFRYYGLSANALDKIAGAKNGQ